MVFLLMELIQQLVELETNVRLDSLLPLLTNPDDSTRKGDAAIAEPVWTHRMTA